MSTSSPGKDPAAHGRRLLAACLALLALAGCGTHLGGLGVRADRLSAGSPSLRILAVELPVRCSLAAQARLGPLVAFGFPGITPVVPVQEHWLRLATPRTCVLGLGVELPA